jgi:hypothetical protein
MTLDVSHADASEMNACAVQRRSKLLAGWRFLLVGKRKFLLCGNACGDKMIALRRVLEPTNLSLSSTVVASLIPYGALNGRAPERA